jgi:5-methylcytosine-specific restriction protein A
MWQPDPDALASELGRYFGLEFIGRRKDVVNGYPSLELRPSGTNQTEAFSISVQFGWRSLDIQLIPDSYAGPLIAEMGRSSSTQRETFVGLASQFEAMNAEVALFVNGDEVDIATPADWPLTWQRARLHLARSPAVVNTDDFDANDREVCEWTRRFLSLALALMPIEELETEVDTNPQGLPEGALVRISTNRYERSRINRVACIEFHGDSCLVCGFNFRRTYGLRGIDFIHVHHVVPVSRLGPHYQINPAKDLVPLCPNCHAMAHRTDPPGTVEELRKIIGR